MTKTTKITKVLIANRGEIAVRIMRTCRDLGIKTVAVYSDADREALHVQYADEAYNIGPAASAESYLVIQKIIDVAKKSGANAIHPGYGFLSEKAPFSKACEDNGIVFLGPRPEAIDSMGNKIGARIIAEKANVPMVPGTKERLKSVDEARGLAKKMGYPVLLKAAAGGGGKGMRVVEKEDEIESAFQRASSEALKSFSDDTLYIEKYVRRARHVEIQVIFDSHGNGVHLFERECSLQRRHQKVIEEAPCSFITQATRDKMTEAAVRLGKTVNYRGVGTLEFLVDEDQSFYFLEMNTRLQVEHPVTELITGLDLVELQILVGEGRKLPFTQEEITRKGCAIEVRIYAEDPENNFFPCPGKIQWLKAPEGPGIRHDCGVYSGGTIPIFYDPMISKLVTWGADRAQATRRMLRALSEYQVGGLRNNIPFLKTLLEHPDYASGEIYTRWIEAHPETFNRKEAKLPTDVLMAFAALDREQGQRGSSAPAATSGNAESTSPWKLTGIREMLATRF